MAKARMFFREKIFRHLQATLISRLARDFGRIERIEIPADGHAGPSQRIARRAWADKTPCKCVEKGIQFVLTSRRHGFFGGITLFFGNHGDGFIDFRIRWRAAEHMEAVGGGLCAGFREFGDFLKPVIRLQINAFRQFQRAEMIADGFPSLRLHGGIRAFAFADLLLDGRPVDFGGRYAEERRQMVDDDGGCAAFGHDAFTDTVGNVWIDFRNVASDDGCGVGTV